MQRDALKQGRKSSHELIAFLSDPSLAALNGVAHPRRTEAKLPRQRCERPAQLPDGPYAQETPGGHPSALPPCGHHLPRVQVEELRHPLDEVRLARDPLIAPYRKSLLSASFRKMFPRWSPRTMT